MTITVEPMNIITNLDVFPSDYHLLLEDAIRYALEIGTVPETVVLADYYVQYHTTGAEHENEAQEIYDSLIQRLPPRELDEDGKKILDGLMRISREMALDPSVPASNVIGRNEP